jgi:RNA polymerase sigma factor (sigma-70 family)
MPFLLCIAIWRLAGPAKIFAVGCFVWHTIRPEIARTATIDGIPRRSKLASSPPWSTILEKEKFRCLEKAIRLLSESERECLLLRAGGLRYREIGEVLGIPTSTVGDTVERAIRKLAEKCNV